MYCKHEQVNLHRSMLGCWVTEFLLVAIVGVTLDAIYHVHGSSTMVERYTHICNIILFIYVCILYCQYPDNEVNCQSCLYFSAFYVFWGSKWERLHTQLYLHSFNIALMV